MILLAKARARSDAQRRKHSWWPILIYFQMGFLAVMLELASFALARFLLFARLDEIPFDWWILRYDPEDGGLGAFLSFLLSYVLSSALSFFLQRTRTFRATTSALWSGIGYALMMTACFLFDLWFPPYIIGFFQTWLGEVAGSMATRLAVGCAVALIQLPINKFVLMRSTEEKPRYKAVVFDLDGTLLNTLDDLAAAGNHALEAQGLAPYPTEVFRYFVGSGIPNLVRRMLCGDPKVKEGDPACESISREMFDAVLGEFERYYAAHKADRTAPYPEIPALLRRLRDAGIPMAVVTNKDDASAKALMERYFGPVFDAVEGRREGIAVKPDPALVFEAINRMGVSPEETLYVGDSDVDMLTAQNAGLDSCGVLWGFRTEAELRAAGAGYIVGSARELGALFGVE